LTFPLSIYNDSKFKGSSAKATDGTREKLGLKYFSCLSLFLTIFFQKLISQIFIVNNFFCKFFKINDDKIQIKSLKPFRQLNLSITEPFNHFQTIFSISNPPHEKTF